MNEKQEAEPPNIIERQPSYEELLIEISGIISALNTKILELPFVDSTWERLAKARMKLVEGKGEIQMMRYDELAKERTTRKLEEMDKWREIGKRRESK